MPDRTKEELQQIHADLLLCMEEIRKIEPFRKCYPEPLNGKSWKEEKAEFFGRIINSNGKLLREVKSCEIRTAIEENTEMWKRKWEFANDYPYHLFFSMRKLENTHAGDLLITDLEEYLRLAIEGTLDQERYEELEKILDELGTSACEIRAFDQPELEYTNQLAQKIPVSSRETIKSI